MERSAFQPDASRLDLPKFMEGAPWGTEHIGAEHAAWVGEPGGPEIDPSAVLDQHGHDSHSPQELLLLAMIDAHQPDLGLARETQLKKVMSAITGIPQGSGRPSGDDDHLLLEVARRYHKARYSSPEVVVELASIIREALECFPTRRTPTSLDHEIGRLRRKFRQNKDLYLVRATSEENWDRMDDRRAVDQIAKELRQRGVNI